jgi:shikimate kinase
MSTLIVLVGPKGAGKTTLGRMLEAGLGARFVEIEAIAKRVLVESGGKIDEGYAKRAFAAIVAHLDGLPDPLMVIETTGASTGTVDFLAALRARHTVHLVRVDVRAEICDARLTARDASRHIAVPPGLVREMYLRSSSLTLPWPWDLVLDNNRELSATEVTDAVRPLI